MKRHAALSLLRLVLAGLVRPVLVLLAVAVTLIVVGSGTRGTPEMAGVLLVVAAWAVLGYEYGLGRST